ncbi:MAG: glycosyltransferase family 2 protein [Gemmatimonadaceae bacterium]|nr:glycosyltransferase family 2 protein [Gemmatimonadaceae bacterium]
MSVVIPTYARPVFLTRAIASLQAQTLDAWELIVVDDNGAGKPDRVETEALMATHAADERIRYVAHERNRGGAAARNTGIELASATLVGFLDDDDEWHPDKLAAQVACLEAADESVALVYCRALVAEEGTPRTRTWETDGASHTLPHLLKRNTIGSTSCVLCRREALVAVGGFDERMPSKQDIDLYVRLAQRYEFAFVDRALVTRHLHAGDSISKNLEGSVVAHRLFYEKYRSHIDALPEVLHHRLASLGKVLVQAGHLGEARSVLWRAWRLRPLTVDVPVHLAMACGLPRGVAAWAGRLGRRLLGARSQRTRNEETG